MDLISDWPAWEADTGETYRRAVLRLSAHLPSDTYMMAKWVTEADQLFAEFDHLRINLPLDLVASDEWMAIGVLVGC